MSEAEDLDDIKDAPGSSIHPSPLPSASSAEEVPKTQLEELKAEDVVETPNSSRPVDDGTVGGPPRRKHADEVVDSDLNSFSEAHQEVWRKHKKHVFILTNAGKPIYSRYGDESKLSGFMGLLQALVSFADDAKDTLRFFGAGHHRVVFVVKGPIVLVCVSCTSEPVHVLEQQLGYMHAQIISILTSGVNRILINKPNVDVRNLLGGLEKFMDTLIHQMNYDPAFLFNSIHFLRMPGTLRDQIGTILQQRRPDLVFSLLVCGYRLINYVRPSRYALNPADIHILLNFINSSTAFRSAEAWTPICLPEFNDKGFLYTYVCYLTDEICLLLLSTRQDAFYELSELKTEILSELTVTNALEQLKQYTKTEDFPMSDVPIPGLLHFLYKSKSSSQIIHPAFSPPYNTPAEAKRLYRLYQHVHMRVTQNPTGKQHKVYYHISQTETILGWTTGGFELFATFGPLETKANAIRACNQILRWIKNEESSLFLLNTPLF